jgi:hypothetical protein
VSFGTWKQLDPIEDIARKLNFDIKRCSSWVDFGEQFRAANGKDVGTMVQRARAIASHLSAGERSVLQAVLHAADFSWLADELHHKGTWDLLSYTRGDHAVAVALVIAKP